MSFIIALIGDLPCQNHTLPAITQNCCFPHQIHENKILLITPNKAYKASLSRHIDYLHQCHMWLLFCHTHLPGSQIACKNDGKCVNTALPKVRTTLYNTQILFYIPVETSFVLSFVPVVKNLPCTLYYKIPCGDPQSFEFPYGDLLRSHFCFVLSLHKVVEMKPQEHWLPQWH